MRTSRSLSLVLAVGLSLTAWSDVAEHDHGTAIERGSYDCTIDHENLGSAQRDAARRPRSTPEINAGGERHAHCCFACKLTRYRSLSASFLPAVDPGPSQASSPEVRALARVSQPWSGRTLRGPPAA